MLTLFLLQAKKARNRKTGERVPLQRRIKVFASHLAVTGFLARDMRHESYGSAKYKFALTVADKYVIVRMITLTRLTLQLFEQRQGQNYARILCEIHCGLNGCCPNGEIIGP